MWCCVCIILIYPNWTHYPLGFLYEDIFFDETKIGEKANHLFMQKILGK
jgi:hypothetical protein